MSKQELIEELLRLPIDEKLEISQILNNSFNPITKEVEDAWIEESLRRVEAYKSGEVKTVSYEEVFAE